MLYLYNTLNRKKEPFIAIDNKHIKMYVCGPTVYDNIHVGNARPIVVFDTLYRLLRHDYPKVTYVRNITDVDDKIILRALENNESINSLTTRVIKSFHEELEALNTLRPTFEPKATDYIKPMQEMIATLLAKGHAYNVRGDIFFKVKSYKDYAALSGFNKEDILNGVRIENITSKEDPADFALWKSVDLLEVGWDSPWGYGRPGWHIECSAMSFTLLGEHFDIHGGGRDLIFPHHENEIAQGVCYSGLNNKVANYWLHNGFITINGQKMSKSLGNVISLVDALQKYHPEVIRLSLLKTHYRQTLDYTDTSLEQARHTLNDFYHNLEILQDIKIDDIKPSEEFLGALRDDLNTPLAISILHKHIDKIKHINNPADKTSLKAMILGEANMLGILFCTPKTWREIALQNLGITALKIEVLMAERGKAKADRNFAKADNIRHILLDLGIIIEDRTDSTKWRLK